MPLTGQKKMRLIELSAFLQHTAANAGLWLYTQHGISHYLRTHYGNDPVNNPFRYLYQWNAFDTTLLIPYFLVMIVLAFYGLHRYQLVYLYYKHRDRAVTDPPSHFAELPSITVQLPIFNEQYVIDRLIDACCRLNYPPNRLVDWSSDIALWGTTSSICIARIATATRQAHSMPA
jgi:hypothetical protein